MKPTRSPYPMHRADLPTAGSQILQCDGVIADAPPPTCGAKTRGGSPCRNMPMKNGRCRMHGGASTGRKTAAGIANHRAAVTIHGGRSREMVEFRRKIRELQADTRRMIELA